MTTLWDTTGTAVVKALAAERRTGGAVTSGLALTLVVVADEKNVADVEQAATIAASKHPMRMLMVIRRQVDAPVPRLDAEVLIGGRLGPGEAVLMRMYGRLALHAESVTLPLLAPDAPVVTWWDGEPPERIAYDPLGVFADRRITDSSLAPDRVAALRGRAADYAPGDTDLSWTRITNWRTAVAGALDGATEQASSAAIDGDPTDPSALLLAGWLASKFGFFVPINPSRSGDLERVTVIFPSGHTMRATNDAGRLLLERTGQPDSVAPFAERSTGELLAEELRRLDVDDTYADALANITESSGLNERSGLARAHLERSGAGRQQRPLITEEPATDEQRAGTRRRPHGRAAQRRRGRPVRGDRGRGAGGAAAGVRRGDRRRHPRAGTAGAGDACRSAIRSTGRGSASGGPTNVSCRRTHRSQRPARVRRVVRPGRARSGQRPSDAGVRRPVRRRRAAAAAGYASELAGAAADEGDLTSRTST